MKKYLSLFVTLILLSNTIYSQIRIKEISSDLPKHLTNYSNTETRKFIQFNDNWILTPENSESNGVKINVPSRYTSDETIIFKKSFEFSPEIISINDLKVHFLGISYSADIYLNDVVIYTKPAGNIPFSLLLPNDLLNAAEKNTITVKVLNELDSKTTIPLYQRFLFPKNSGGIVRDVYLEIIPKKNIELVRFSTSIDNQLKNIDIKFDLHLSNKSTDEQYLINLSIFDYTGTSIANKKFELNDQSIDLELKLNVKNPNLWSPKTPHLYSVKIELIKNDSLIDVTKTNVIFTKFENRPEGLFLNNKNFAINGVTYIHSSKEYGMLTSYSELRKDLEIIKELGINTVRFAKATPHPFALEICAELGLLAFIEVPINSVPDRFLEDENFKNRLSSYTEEFTKEYSNYPAVFAMGIGSGYLSISQMQIDFVSELSKVIKLKSRKLSFASFLGIPAKEINNLDLYGIELFENSAILEKYLKTTSINKNKIFISEATYPTYLGNTNGYLNKFSLESQAKFFDETIDLTRSKKLTGFFINSMFDFYGDFSSLFTKYSDENKYAIGVIGEDRNINRISYNLLKSKLISNKRTTIPLGNKKDDAPMFFILAGLALAVMMGILVNSKKKFREDATRALLRPYNFFADIRDHRIMSGLATIIMMFILAGSHALLISNLLFFFRNSITFEKLLLSFGVPSLISGINYLAWSPYESFFFFTLMSIVFFLIISVFISIASFFLKMKIYFRNIFITVVWAVLPLSILLPAKMVLYRILIVDIINPYIYGFLILYLFWILQRVIKGVYVIFDISLGRAYFFTILLIVLSLGGILSYFQLSYSTIDLIINSIYQAQLI